MTNLRHIRRPRPPFCLAMLVVALVFFAALPARAQDAYALGQDPYAYSSPAAEPSTLAGMADFSLGMGYVNITLDDSPIIDSESGFRFDPTLTFSPLPEALPQLRLGVGVGFNLVLDDSQRALISNDGQLIFFGSSDVPLWLFEPELRVSWRQWFGDTWFVEGGVAGGFALGYLELDSIDDTDDSYDANDTAPFGRAFFRVGARVTGGIAGFEGSYLVGDELDFGGNASGELTEWYVGIFGAIVF